MDNPGRRKPVEPGGGRTTIGADVSAVEKIVALQVGGELFRHRNNVQPVTGRAEHGTNLQRSFFESVQVILAVVEN